MDPNPGPPPEEPLALKIASRLVLVGAAIICCFLLYRLGQGYYYNRYRSGHSISRRTFGGRKDILYSRLPEGAAYGDEQDGYRDADTASNQRASSNELLNRPLPDRPLPDKPLPPLPEGD
jgi:hypothetical protein